MINREGHYILTLADWNAIIKYFLLTPQSINIKETPDLMFTEYKVYDIYSKKVLFSFYDHDGMIRIPGNGKLIAYEIDISQILNNKNRSNKPPKQIIDAVMVNTHRKLSVKNFKNNVKKIIGKTDTSN